MSDDNDDDRSDDGSDNALPSRGVIPTGNRGWQGEHMELAHATRTSAERQSQESSAAVDLSQFRNEEVGKGYQARFVVRQRHAQDEGSAPPAVKDMTQKKETKESRKKKSKRKRSRSKEDDDDDREKESDSASHLDKYLKSEALRRFRKELEKF